MSLSLLTLAHILTGTLAVIGGAAAFLAPKGRPVHRAGGSLFFGGMLASAATGAWLGLLEPERLLITAFAGLLAAYLVLTGWRAARWTDGRPGGLEFIAFAAILATIAGLVGLGVTGLQAEDGRALGFAAENYFMLAIMAGLGGASDIALLVRRRLSDRQRVARHLWRMGLAYFIAVGSFFTGPGASVFPLAVRESGLLSAPEGITALLILFFLARTLFNRPRRKAES
jgi:hypothetical protein